ncbi:MAG: hypothetical protein J5756_00165 [Clostridia bacterium]|nr:hypothetical protein [Clostridia bacterium]
MEATSAKRNSFEQWCYSINRIDYLNLWDSKLNLPLTPSAISRGSHKKYYWHCSSCGKSFLRAPHSFTIDGQNRCQDCSIKFRGEKRHITAVSKNNFASNYPELIEEWDCERNSLSPRDVAYTDNKKYWWKCKKCGNIWQTSITNRVRGTGCPKCRYITRTSFPERAVFYYVNKYYPDAVSNDTSYGFELDVFIPSKKIGIEYDGQQWHQNIKKDSLKNNKCAKNGIVLFRIRERECWFWRENSYLKLIPVSTRNDEELNNAIQVLLLELDFPFADINIKRDKKSILATYLMAKKQNSLLEKYPQIAKEFDLVKNQPLTPDNIDYGSGIKCHWVCSKCGYEYVATPNTRTLRGSGCPSCAHTVAWKGHTDIFTTNPELKEEWDYEKNKAIGLNPDKLLAGSEKQAYWICSKGHSWKTAIANRKIGHGCPICAVEKHNKKVVNIDTGMIFSSIKEAAAYYGKAKGTHIVSCCKGERETAYGFHWKYYED